MHKELLARGIRVGRKRVRRLMQQHGIRAKTQHKFVVTTDSRHSPAGGPGPGTATFQSRYTRPAPVWQHHLHRHRRRLGVPGSGHRPVQPLGGGLEHARAQLLIRQALFVNLARAEVSKPLDGLKLNGIGTLQ